MHPGVSLGVRNVQADEIAGRVQNLVRDAGGEPGALSAERERLWQVLGACQDAAEVFGADQRYVRLQHCDGATHGRRGARAGVDRKVLKVLV